MPLEGTADIAIWLTIRSVLLDTEVHGHIPVNAGLIRPITIIAPKGCLANPTFPAPTIARFCPGNQLADTVMKALSQAMPGNVSAGIGNLKVIAFSGLKNETHWVHMHVGTGGRFVCYGPAGGGYGNPLERDPAKVADDVLDGVISVDTALKDYAVVISPAGVVDQAATAKQRAAR